MEVWRPGGLEEYGVINSKFINPLIDVLSSKYWNTEQGTMIFDF